MIINFYDATMSYTAMLLNIFNKLQLRIDDSNLYTIPIVYGTSSRLYKKLNNPTKEFSYRVPIMSLEVNMDVQAGKVRSTNPLLKRASVDLGDDEVIITYNDKPTDYTGTITIIGDSLTSLTNIVESINAMFYHDILYATYKTPLGEEIRTPVILEGIDINLDNNEDVADMERTLEATISLRVEGVVHSNYNLQSKIITDIHLLLHDYTVEYNNIIEQYSIDGENNWLLVPDGVLTDEDGNIVTDINNDFIELGV